MTLEEVERLPETKRREVKSLLYRAMLKEENSPMKRCPACGEDFPVRTFGTINDEGTEVCERCVFVLALYQENRIRKQFKEGGLHPSLLNAKFRKILEEEFYVNQREAYHKHLGGMIRREEEKQRIIWIDGAEIRRIKADFPFYLMTDDEVQRFHPEEGAELCLRYEEEGSKPDIVLKRRIYAMHRIPARTAKRYCGRTDRRTVCFLPEVYDK